MYNEERVSMEYIAGFIDADGHIGKDTQRVVITNTNKALLKKIQESLEYHTGIKAKLYTKKVRSGKHNTVYDLIILKLYDIWVLHKCIELQIDYKRNRLEKWATKYRNNQATIWTAMAAYDLGSKPKDIAEVLNVHVATIYRWIKKYGA